MKKSVIESFTMVDLLEKFQELMKQGKNQEALELFTTLPENEHPPQVILARKLNDLIKRKRGGAETWREYLDRLAALNSAQPIISTFEAQNGFNFSDAENRLVFEGDKPGELTDGRYLTLTTSGEQNCVWAFRDMPEVNQGLVIHLLVSLSAYNVGDNFYLKVIWEDLEDNELIRLGNNGVTLCRDNCYYEIQNRKAFYLYTIAVESEWCKVFINGFLIFRKKRKKQSRPLSIEFELKGMDNAKYGARITGLEIWSLDKLFVGLDLNEELYLLRKAKHIIDSGDIKRLYNLLTSIEGIYLASVEGGCLDLMTEAIRSRKITQEWVVEEISKHLSIEGQERWRKTAEILTPSPAIEVENLSVIFSKDPSTDLSLGRILLRKKRDLFNVLKDLNFKIYPGDIAGIIGQNGAGKTTLLKTLAGLIPIDKGRVFVGGKFLLLRPGIGMRPELSGRENILQAGTYMGLSLGDIRNIIDEIVEFSELGEAIDRPFKFYSSGMKSRLIFSLATSISPEILMLDELLSAGDIKFREKVNQRLNNFIERAKVVIVVTHAIAFVRDRCNKALYLSKGRQVYFGDPEIAVSHYLDDLHLLPADVSDQQKGSLLESFQDYDTEMD